jgi:hypothetical protein
LVLILLAVFGGLLDFADLVALPVERWVAVVVAFGLVALDRELKVLELRWRLDHSRDLQERLDELARFRSEGIVDIYSKTPTSANFANWEKSFQDWEKRLMNYLKGNFPFAVYELLEDLGEIPGKQFVHLSQDPTIQGLHLHYLRMLAKILEILEEIIQENTSLTKDREPTLAEVLQNLV